MASSGGMNSYATGGQGAAPAGAPAGTPGADRMAGLWSGAIQTDPSDAGGRGGKLTLNQQLLKDQQLGVGMGGLGGGTPASVSYKPGGGNQNAWSPTPATVVNTPATPGGPPPGLRALLAQLMARSGKLSGTGDQGGYTTSGR